MLREERECLELIEESGPWRFVTHRIYRHPDGTLHHWHSRLHRKGLWKTELKDVRKLGREALRCLWMPEKLNWWIGVIFAIGASCFLIASMLSLLPELPAWLSVLEVNALFFLGSIPFTTAAYLQLYQAANHREFLPSLQEQSNLRRQWFGWRPHDLGWWSCSLQFAGTLLFNINTFDAMLPGLKWVQEDLLVWIPNILGSILFLLSGYFAFIENNHCHWAWHPSSLSWWVVFTNLLGCIFFMTAAIFALALPVQFIVHATALALIFTGLGAIGFLIGSLVMLPETLLVEEDQ